MKKIKVLKRISLLLAVLMILPLFSCSGNEHPTNDKETDGIDSVTTADNSSSIEETTAPTEKKDVKLSFIAAGDNIGHEAVFTDAYNRATENSLEYNFVPMYNDIAPLIGNADIAFINQETLKIGRAHV